MCGKLKVNTMISQITILLAVSAISFSSGWTVHGWYESSKQKEVITFFNDQTLKDGDALLIAEIELDDYKRKAANYEKRARKINKGICHSADSHRNFNRVYNDAIRAANSQSAQ